MVKHLRHSPWKIYGEGPPDRRSAFHDTEAQPFTAQDFPLHDENDVLYACELVLAVRRRTVISLVHRGTACRPRLPGVAARSNICDRL